MNKVVPVPVPRHLPVFYVFDGAAVFLYTGTVKSKTVCYVPVGTCSVADPGCFIPDPGGGGV
jgi:hypothetical protein